MSADTCHLHMFPRGFYHKVCPKLLLLNSAKAVSMRSGFQNSENLPGINVLLVVKKKNKVHFLYFRIATFGVDLVISFIASGVLSAKLTPIVARR